ncbi:MAG: hypothetical protein AAGD47_13470 [Pseudomonadota bacterium]
MTQPRHGGPTIEERHRTAARTAKDDIDKNQRMVDRNDMLPGGSRTARAGVFRFGDWIETLGARAGSSRARRYLLLLLIAAVIGAVIGMVVSGM